MKNTTPHSTWRLCILNGINLTFFYVEGKVEPLFGLEYIEIGDASFLSVVQSRIFVEEYVSLLFEIPEEWRGHEEVLAVDWIVLVGIRRAVVIGLGIFVELAQDELLSRFGID